MRQPLPYRVECKQTVGPWETIAAFNVDSVAIEYARRCRASNAEYGFSYRVKIRGAIKWQDGVHRCDAGRCESHRESGFLFCADHLAAECKRHARRA